MNIRRIILAATALTIAGVTILAVSGPADASPVGPQILDKGVYSIQDTITNNTGVDWTLVPSETYGSLSGGHWQQQPQDVLHARSSEVVTAYSNNPIMTEDLEVTYTLPNGDYAISWPEVGVYGPNNTVIAGVYTTDRNGNPLAKQDPGFPSTNSISGGAHVNATFTANQTS